jgi:hypothetical protein
VKEILHHRLPLAVTIDQKAKLAEHISLIFSDIIRLQPISSEQGQSLYQQLMGEPMPEGLTSVLEGATPDDFLKLKGIMAKVSAAEGAPDHTRAHDLLKRMKAARVSQAHGIGFVHN